MDDFVIHNRPPDAPENPYWLKARGIEALKALVGDVWSLYNDVDPGVTILEHLCWALSEIAYCASFPMADLLAGDDGGLAVPGQFPDQAHILSHQPVTADDYAKGLFDHVPGLRALQILPERDAQGAVTGRQLCYLAAAGHMDHAARRHLQHRTWAYLRQWRLPGHNVLPPRWLHERPLSLTARIIVADAKHAVAIADRCVLALDRLVAPVPQRRGYHTLRGQGLDGPTIINGPSLHHGWMLGPLPELPDAIRLSTLAALLSGVEGVNAVLSIRMIADGQEVKHITLDAHEIAAWTLDLEFWSNDFLCHRHQGSSSSTGLEAMKDNQVSRGIGAGIDLCAPMPEGRFRNLADYQPVQRTFPPNWGLSGQEVDRTNLETAQVLQLQGYLMPFEQLLTNQFAQLANLGHLFSSHPAPAPERGDRPDDVPWRPLARTVFSQPLYQVPDVQDLITGHDMFDDWLGEPRPDGGWQEARDYSHNPYRHALATQTESEHDAVTHRLRMLRHLLARHGEETADYDPMILAFQWYGSPERTLMVVHGLWLRNLTFLSQARSCGARYPAPALALPGDTALPDSAPRFAARLIPQPAHQVGTGADTPWWQRLLAWPELNGRPDLDRIEQLATLDNKSLAGTSSFELKLGLILDLPSYLGQIAARLARTLYAPGLREWLAYASRAGAHFDVPECELRLLATADGVLLFEGGARDRGDPADALVQILWDRPGARTGWPDFWHTPGDPTGPRVGTAEDERFLTCHAHLLQLLWLATQRRGVLLLEPVLLAGDDQMPGAASRLTASLFWPDWVTQVAHRLPTFIETMRQRHWPSHVDLDARGVSFARMAPLIPAFVHWHNLYGQQEADADAVAKAGPHLATLLTRGMP